MTAWLSERDRTEARRLCVQARRLLEQAYEQAKSARNWGILDMLGGDLISGLVKHSHVYDAQSSLNQAKPILQRLCVLLQQNGLDSDLEGTNISGLSMVLDIGFDGILTDLYMQSKIGNMKSSIENALGKLYALERQL